MGPRPPAPQTRSSTMFRSESSRAMLSAVIWATITVVLLLSFLFSSLALRRAETRRPSRTFADEVPVLGAPVWRALTLNYTTWAADLRWVETLIYYGEIRRAHRDPEHLLLRAEQIAALDPDFYRPTEWAAAAFFSVRSSITGEDIETVNRFLDRAAERFPERHELPYMAGMNYIGYAPAKEPRARAAEMARAIGYLERAVELDPSNEVLPFTIGYLYSRRRQLLSKAGQGEASTEEDLAQARAFFGRLYSLSQDAAMRERLEAKLRSLGVKPEELVEAQAFGTAYRERRRESLYGFLPDAFWFAVEAPSAETTKARVR